MVDLLNVCMRVAMHCSIALLRIFHTFVCPFSLLAASNVFSLTCLFPICVYFSRYRFSDELQTLLKDLKQMQFLGLSKDYSLEAFDADKSGSITFEEFYEW